MAATLESDRIVFPRRRPTGGETRVQPGNMGPQNAAIREGRIREEQARVQAELARLGEVPAPRQATGPNGTSARVLNAMRRIGRPVTFRELCAAVPDKNAAAVSGGLMRLVAAGRVESFKPPDGHLFRYRVKRGA